MEMKVTLVVNAHREGLLLWRALKSAQQNRENLLMSHGVGCDILIVADDPAANAHDETLSIAQRFCDEYDAKLINTRHGDLGLARNSAIDAAKTEFIAFLDADDIWGPHWISRAYAYMMSDETNKQRVLHPQIIVNFGGDMLWWQHTDSRSPEFDPSCFFITNAWTAHNFASRDLYLQHKYRSVGDGFGFEDWEWNSRTLATGITHAVVPETVHFIRKRGGSMSQVHANESRVPRPNDFWEHLWINQDKTEPASLSVGKWLSDEWLLAHQIEPLLWPSPREMYDRVRYEPPTVPKTFMAYWLLKRSIPKGATHLILFAGHGGGADVRALHYADAVSRNGGIPALIATDNNSSLPKDKFLNASKLFSSLPASERARICLRLMLQHDGVIHIINSRTAWGALVHNPKVFKSKGKTYVSIYAFEHLKGGRLAGYAGDGSFEQAMPGIYRVITDNLKLQDDLSRIFGWTDSVYATTPIEWKDTKHNKSERVKRVLWAGTANWNKNLDLLVEIALEALKQQAPLLFEVFGDSNDYHGYKAIDKLKKIPNVITHAKSFNGWDDIKPERFDVMAFTSRHEGFPNVVLEAMAHGIPVVSTPAGGLKRTAEEFGGFPGAFVETPKEFVEWLKRAPEVFNTKKYVEDNHSIQEFDCQLREDGYFVGLGGVSHEPSNEDSDTDGSQNTTNDSCNLPG